MTIGKCDLVKRKAKNGIGGKIHVTLIRPKVSSHFTVFQITPYLYRACVNLDVAMYGFVTKFSL